MQVVLTNKMLAAAAIVRQAGANPNITTASLQSDLERGDIDGWATIARRYKLNLSTWSGAMEEAIRVLEVRAR